MFSITILWSSHISTSHLRVKNRHPWLTNALLKSTTVNNNISTLSVLEPTNVSLKMLYKSFKNKITSLLRNAELDYYSSNNNK